MIVIYFLSAGLFVLLFTREVIAPASGAACDKRWRLYSGSLNAANIVVVVLAGFIFHDQISALAVFDLESQTGAIVGSFVVFLTASLIAYWWHRLTHHSDTLWRVVHQLHHSPSRVETLTAFYVHPMDSFLAALINAIVAYGLFGASPAMAGLALFWVAIFNLVAHADLHTPRWLGFILQRPEMHRLHHQRGLHRSNYGLPMWDMVFGTWRNPEYSEVECGFPPEKEYRIKDMLLMKDVDG